MKDDISRDEREFIERKLAELDKEIADTSRALAEVSGPYITGQSKDYVKGAMELQLANLLKQRAEFRERLGLDPDA